MSGYGSWPPSATSGDPASALPVRPPAAEPPANPPAPPASPPVDAAFPEAPALTLPAAPEDDDPPRFPEPPAPLLTALPDVATPAAPECPPAPDAAAGTAELHAACATQHRPMRRRATVSPSTRNEYCDAWRWDDISLLGVAIRKMGRRSARRVRSRRRGLIRAAAVSTNPRVESVSQARSLRHSTEASWIGRLALLGLLCSISRVGHAGQYVFATFTVDPLANERLSTYRSSNALDFSLVSNRIFGTERRPTRSERHAAQRRAVLRRLHGPDWRRMLR